MKFTWEGRQLRTTAANGKSISYFYNSDGTRVGFTYNGAVRHTMNSQVKAARKSLTAVHAQP
ncbi:hypothetical protein [Aminicella lysinilytica]|jgi:hypothetical protein|uniref:hypothetical protein n=1 Tax=Aminicella lysinilytica TaxID=433323 RepID=UPI0026EDEBBB|nr:hypothetical protein [Aminicella lysinilytica]